MILGQSLDKITHKINAGGGGGGGGGGGASSGGDISGAMGAGQGAMGGAMGGNVGSGAGSSGGSGMSDAAAAAMGAAAAAGQGLGVGEAAASVGDTGAAEGLGGLGGPAGMGGGGQSTQSAEEAAIDADLDTGNFSGMATGFGQSGYGSPSEGMPGVFGGGVLGGVQGIAGALAGQGQGILGDLGNIASTSALGSQGLNAMSETIGNVTSAVGSETSSTLGEAMAAAAAAGQGMSPGAVAASMGDTAAAEGLGGFSGDMADLALGGFVGAPPGTLNAAYGNLTENMGFMDSFDLAFNFYSNNTPLALSAGLSMLGVPVTAAQAIAAAGAALTGNLAAADNSVGVDAGPGNQGQIPETEQNVRPQTSAPTQTDTGLDLNLPGYEDPFAGDEDLADWYDSLLADQRRGVTWASLRSGRIGTPNVYTPYLF